MRLLQLTCILVAITTAAICQIVVGKTLSARALKPATTEVVDEVPAALAFSAEPDTASVSESPLSAEERAAVDVLQKDPGGRLEKDQAEPEENDFSVRAGSPEPKPQTQGRSYLAYYAYSELPPDKKPADMVLDTLKDVPLGTPVEEIKHAADAFGLDFGFMRAVAKIESDFDPKQRTGQYIGLFQLNNAEFRKYGSGEITNPRDNAVAAAYKFVTEATLFELDAHKQPTFSDLYLIHQQGWQGAAEHVSHPERAAWKSMCATDEGREKGEKWCKRAIWGNTLPAIKHIWKSVENLTSGAFVDMWRQRVDLFYARYSEATTTEKR